MVSVSFNLGEDFVAEVVMKSVVRLVWGCLSGRMHFMWRLSVCRCKGKCQMSVDASSVYV